MRLTGGDVLLRCLAAQRVRAVFGMPGTQNIALYDAFHRSGEGIAHFLIRHEQGATIMAGGFARARGDLAAAFTVPGPGAANAATGVLDAYNDCVPLLLVVGGFDRGIAHRDRSKMFHGLDQEAFFRPFTRYFGRPANAADIPRVVSEAFEAMFAGRHGPAVIEMPPDVAAEEAPASWQPPAFVPRRKPQPASRDEVVHAARLIGSMRRPIVWVGTDCTAAGAEDEARQLAEQLQAPVVYGRRGKGIVSDDHELTCGFTRSKRVAELLRDADGLVALGVRFAQIDTHDWKLQVPRQLVQFDRNPIEPGREYPAAAAVVGDLAGSVHAVRNELDRTGLAVDPGWSARARQTHREWRSLPPIPVLSQIREALPPGGLISVDVTATGYECFDRFPVPDSRSLIYPCHSVALGYGFPAAIGAKLACPERPVVALCGDAGFLMGCYELATAVDYGVNVVAVVVRDECLTAIRGSQEQAFDGRTVDVRMAVPDFAALARSFGAGAISLRDPAELPEAIESALGRPGPTIVELRLEDRGDELVSVIPWLHGE